MRESMRDLFPAARHAFWQAVIRDAERIQEIRLRIGRPVIIRRADGECYLDNAGSFTAGREAAHRATETELEELFSHICHDSPYAFEDELRQGFLTVPGGHRVGVVGQAVMEADGSIRTMKHIYYMNIRISHQIFGAADRVLPLLYEDGRLRNTLILSPPGCGKTTLLRELVRLISEGNPYGKGMHVGVVDERSELAGSYLGIPQNDLGSRTDVLDACPKALGMMVLLRSMSPQVIAVDELGGEADAAALRTAASCGSRILATVHGADLGEVYGKFPDLIGQKIFERVIVLEKRNGQPALRRLYRGEEIAFATCGRDYDPWRLSGDRTVVSGPVDGQDPRAALPDRDTGTVHERDTLRKSHVS